MPGRLVGKRPGMADKDPQGITTAGIAAGEKKADLPPGKMLVGAFLAGSYIAFASLLAVTVSAGLDPAVWGTLPTLFTGFVFVLGLVLVVVAGSELLTGNMALLPLAGFKGRLGAGRIARQLRASSPSATCSARCSSPTSSPSRPASSPRTRCPRGWRRSPR